MSDDSAFLAAIREQPDDAIVRLVYADWLQERGDARHELIRVEAAMRAVPIWSDEFQRLKPDRTRLRAALPRDWLAAMDYLPKHRPMFGTLPPTAEERWRLAEEFIDIWHGGLKPGDGYSEAEVAGQERSLGCRFPDQLRAWYTRAGKRQDIWTKQDTFLPLRGTRLVPEGLVFRDENQGVWSWYVRRRDLTHPDPPVYCTNRNVRDEESITETMLYVLVFETLINQRFSASFEYSPTIRHPMPNRFQKMAIGAGIIWEAEDTVAMERHFACCRIEEAYERLVADFGDRVDRLS